MDDGWKRGCIIAAARVATLVWCQMLAAATPMAHAELVGSGGQRVMATSVVEPPYGIASVPPAGFIVTFRERRPFQNQPAVDFLAQRTDEVGRLLGAPIVLLDDYFVPANDGAAPALGVDAQGRLLLAFQQGNDVFLRAADLSGSSLGPDVHVGLVFPTTLARLRLLLDSSGGPIVMWRAGSFLYGRAFDSDLQPRSALWSLPSTADSVQAVITTSDHIVVGWQEDAGYEDPCVSKLQKTDRAGTVVAGPLVLPVDDGEQCRGLSLARTDGGAVMAVALTGRNDYQDVRMRSVAVGADLQTVGPVQQLVPQPALRDAGPSETILLSAEDELMLVWTGSDHIGRGVFLRTLASDGAFSGEQLGVNTTRMGNEEFPRAALANGRAAVVWATWYGRVDIRSFCDSEDPSCRRCPDAASDEDSDGDGLPDGCDSCNDPDAESIIGKLTVLARDGKGKGYTLTGELSLPPGAPPFSDYAFDQTGAFLRIRGRGDGDVLEVGLPAEYLPTSGYKEGWVRKGTGTTWSFVGARYDSYLQTGNGELRRVLLKELEREGRRIIKFKIVGGTYYHPRIPVLESDLPVHVSFLLGTTDGQDPISCHDITFDGDDCTLDTTTWTARCSTQ
ncbi:MAG TPA: hypothetical protein VEL28_01895 [Candidatus Binatia bacterium]|nr:hypothetical protein [Candidatus Binatia bacterium]